MLKPFCDAAPWRLLQVGIRMGSSWQDVVEQLIDDPLMTQDMLARLVISIHEHGESLALVSPKLWPKADHNHFFTESVGLLAVTALLPELADSKRWRDEAIHRLGRCVEAQFTPDGGQIEGCPGYHDGCVIDFCLAVRFAKEAGISLPPAAFDRLRRAINYTVYASRPTGCQVPWGDSDVSSLNIDAALWWLSASGDAEPLKRLAGLVGEGRVCDRARDLVWELGNVDNLLRPLATPSVQPLPLVSWQHGLDQVALRTSWASDALGVFFACRTPVKNGHAHIDPTGFDFTAFGKAMVVDPGRFCYREDDDRRTFKSARWHNTLTINDRDPFEYRRSFAYGPQKPGCITGVWHGEGLMAAACMHRNYEPAVSRRAVALVGGRCLVVLDAVDGLTAKDSVQRWFHLDTTKAEWQTEKQRAVAKFDDGTGLTVASVSLNGSVVGSLEPGRVSERVDTSHASLRLRLENATGSARRCFATILIPSRSGAQEPRIDKLVLDDSPEGLRFQFVLDGKDYTLKWTNGEILLK